MNLFRFCFGLFIAITNAVLFDRPKGWPLYITIPLSAVICAGGLLYSYRGYRDALK